MQKLQLSIPEPCHENWQQMTPTEQGRYCNACAKEVIDFSTMTDIQVLNYFTNMATEKVCGRALPEQLDRTLSRPEHPKKKIFWYWNYIVMLLMFFTKGNSAKAQGAIKPATELNPVDNLAVKGELNAVERKRIITGKVTDIHGNPVSFASIKVKGTNTGVSADAIGAYSLKVNPNAILVIAGAGYKDAEVAVGNLNVISTVLEKSTGSFTEGVIVVTVGGMGYRNMDDYTAPVKIKSVAVIKVKDAEINKFIPNASVIISSSSFVDTMFTNNKGEHKIKGIKKYQKYFIKVAAEGYEPNEFTIDGSDFKDRKKEWEVLLKKEKLTEEQTRETNINNALTGKVADVQIRTQSADDSAKETRFRVGGIATVNASYTPPIYVVDGLIEPNRNPINTDKIEDISFLNAAQATALYGIKGANGAIIITTKKLPVKNLDTVTVTAFSNRLVGQLTTTTCTTTSVMGGMIKGITVKSSVTDSLKMLANTITGAIKVFPNPVQEGVPFNVALKLKQAGLYLMQVTDATGRIVLQKQFNANSKEYTETIMPDSRWSSGAYYISIIDNKNKPVNKCSFIFR